MKKFQISWIRTHGGAVGIDLHKRPPVERLPVQPVILMFDEAYADTSPATVIATAKMLGGEDATPPGTPVTIMSLSPGSATVWIGKGGARCIAEVLGPEAEQLSAACRSGQTGFLGRVTSDGTADGQFQIQVQINGN